VGRDGQLLEQPKSTLVSLAADLAAQELKVEFYLLGGAVLFQAFRTRPPTAHVSGLFASGELVEAAARRLAERKKLPADWVPAAVTETLGGTKPDARADRYLDVAGLAAFAPPAEYVLAVKVAALRVDADARALDDVRYLLRALNLRSAAAALDIVSRYFGPRQLAPNTEPLLRGLLAG
jgi:hypothetical protein